MKRQTIALEDGFTMIIAIGTMFVAGLLMVAAFTVANDDTHLSHIDTIQKQAYYAALAGIQEYEYKLESEPNYWQTCTAPAGAVAEAQSERYEINLLPANGKTKCESSKPFETMIESTGQAANTFRVESVGCAGKTELTTCTSQPHSTVAVRRIVASFRVTGFLQFVYFTRYEDEDYTLNGTSQANCEKYYVEKGVTRNSECTQIEFVTGDNVNGPMHTDDTAVVCGEPEFGRKGHTPLDKVEINGGLHEACGAKPIFNTESKSYSTGRELVPPASDESLLAYVESANKFSGVTQLVLNGTTNTITVVSKGEEKSIAWPANGLIYVGNSGACGFTFTGHAADGPKEKSQETNCGNVYVHGTYSKSLTIAAENDLIINGNTYPSSVTTLGNEPSGTATLGLIASHFVRIYHPVGETYAATKNRFGGYSCNNGDTLSGTTCYYQNSENGCDAANLSATEDKEAGGYGWGTQKNIWIYAAILSTRHSFAVDNFNCGSELGELNVYGAIAQNFRGIVGTGGAGGTGYIKNYNYDGRLASSQPPYFLEPLNTGWEVARETAPEAG